MTLQCAVKSNGSRCPTHVGGPLPGGGWTGERNSTLLRTPAAPSLQSTLYPRRKLKGRGGQVAIPPATPADAVVAPPRLIPADKAAADAHAGGPLVRTVRESRASIEQVVADEIRWRKNWRRAWSKRGLPSSLDPDEPIEVLDLAPDPDPIQQVVNMDVMAQAAAHVGCHPGVITVQDPNDSSITLCPTRCKKWTCPKCGPVLARIWAKRIADAKPQRMITLTCDHKRLSTPALAYEAMKEALPQLVRLARRQIGPIEYAAVWELHEDGYPHLHLAARGHYIPQKWLSRTWDNLGIGPIVDVRKVKTGKGAALYMSKYMTKTVAAGKSGIHLTRVIQASAGYFEKSVFSVKSYVPPGGKAQRCRADAYTVMKYLIDHCDYIPDPSCKGPPWKFIPTLDAAHRKDGEAILSKLSCL